MSIKHTMIHDEKTDEMKAVVDYTVDSTVPISIGSGLFVIASLSSVEKVRLLAILMMGLVAIVWGLVYVLTNFKYIKCINKPVTGGDADVFINKISSFVNDKEEKK